MSPMISFPIATVGPECWSGGREHAVLGCGWLGFGNWTSGRGAADRTCTRSRGGAVTSARLEIPVLQVDHTSDDLATAFEEAGCCVVERAVSPSVMDSVAADMAPFVESTPAV